MVTDIYEATILVLTANAACMAAMQAGRNALHTHQNQRLCIVFPSERYSLAKCGWLEHLNMILIYYSRNLNNHVHLAFQMGTTFMKTSKPIDRARLRSTCARWLRLQKWIDPVIGVHMMCLRPFQNAVPIPTLPIDIEIRKQTRIVLHPIKYHQRDIAMANQDLAEGVYTVV